MGGGRVVVVSCGMLVIWRGGGMCGLHIFRT